MSVSAAIAAAVATRTGQPGFSVYVLLGDDLSRRAQSIPMGGPAPLDTISVLLRVAIESRSRVLLHLLATLVGD